MTAGAAQGPSQTPTGSIQVEGVSKVYVGRDSERSLAALIAVSFTVEGGQFVSLVGPSGCGKTTLLMTIAGLTNVSSGRILIDDKTVHGPRRSVGVMFQTPELFRWRSVIDNVLLPVDVFGLDRKVYQERAHHLLQLVGLGGFERAFPQELSGGMEQRTALCRVLVADPSIVLMDEPFGAVDEFTRERLNIELLRIWEESRKTVLFVTHNIGEAIFLSDRVIVMAAHPGRIVADIAVPLPRPRTVDTMRAPEYHETLYQIRDLLGLSH
jgi:NitT/TauT family transport system ATP-binding protein